MSGSSTIWQRDANWVGSHIDDSLVMLHLETGKYVALNRTAAALWDILEEPCGQPEIEAKLMARFAVSAEACHAEIAAVLEQMRGLSLVSA